MMDQNAVNVVFSSKVEVWPQGEIWGLGDQASIAVLMEELEKTSYDLVPAPQMRQLIQSGAASDPEA